MRILVVIAEMLGFTLLGIALRASGLVRPTVSTKLNALAMNITLPAGIFLALHRFAISKTALVPSAIFAVLTFVWWGLSEVVARALKLSSSRRAVFILTVVFANTAFIGFPVIEAVFGEAAKARAVLIDQIGGEPLAFTVGAFIAAQGAHEALAIPWHTELKRLLLFPPMLALAGGVLWQLLQLPEMPVPVSATLRGLSTLTVPIVMIALGLVIRAGSLRQSWRTAAVVAVLRLIVAPLTAWLATR